VKPEAGVRLVVVVPAVTPPLLFVNLSGPEGLWSAGARVLAHSHAIGTQCKLFCPPH